MTEPNTILNLAHLNNNPPKTRQELEEALDAILTEWFEELADDDIMRKAVSDSMADECDLFLP